MQPANTWDRAEAIFAQALQLPDGEREAFVRAQCAPDPFLCGEVLRLLAAERRMGSFLDASLLDFRSETFGPYRALEEIGRGGMSVVYLGRRQDDFDRQVAIKVLLTQAGAAPETAILAALEHPHIARFYDAGLTSLGFRYIVMEYVAGLPCVDYPAARTDRDKLLLFLDLCAGVQAAHRALVVHRDLKPSNILIAPEGQLKILDFGISKMLSPSGEQTVGPRAFTLDYASPEQLAAQPASTSNDVYSLGVILCEWLSGQLPRQLSALPLAEALRVSSTNPPLPARLQGDLRRIVAKALAADPALRYDSVGALAQDVRAYLDGRAIAARPASFAYLASRFVARHRFAAAATLLVVLGVAGLALFAARQAQLANQRFEQVRSLSNAVVFDLLDAVEPLAGASRARQLIAERSQSYLDVVARHPGASDAVLLDAARAYLRLAQVPGPSPDSNNAAADRRQRAIALCRRVLDRSPGHAEAQRVLAAASSPP